MGGEGGVLAKSDFILKGALTKHLMRGGVVKKGQKSSDIIYGRPLMFQHIHVQRNAEKGTQLSLWISKITIQ